MILRCRIFYVKFFDGRKILCYTRREDDFMGEIEVEGLIVEWDDKKAEINRKKHDVTFEMAARVFLDENLIEDLDELHSDDEDRIKVIGMVAKVLVVIYTE